MITGGSDYHGSGAVSHYSELDHVVSCELVNQLKGYYNRKSKRSRELTLLSRKETYPCRINEIIGKVLGKDRYIISEEILQVSFTSIAHGPV